MSSVTIAAVPKRTDPSSTKESRPVILLVDDDEAVRSILSRTLTHFGYVVVECDSGEAAMLEIQREDIAFDLVLCDTFLGGMNGDETARLIGLAKPELPLIAMSGYPRDADGATGGQLKRYFIAKPFRVQALSDLLQQALARA